MEDYKAKYEEALERAKKIKHDIETIGCSMDKDMLELIFPELKESEDERIRAKLIEFFAGYTTDEEWWGSVTEKDILAWLEKKGEQKATVSKFKIGQTIKKEGFNIGFTIAKIENGFYYDTTGSNFPINDEKNWKLVEQKPAEWSEEDEERYLSCLKRLSTGNIEQPETVNTVWLKSLKDRYTWKPSDEQMKALKLSTYCPSEQMSKVLFELYQDLKKLREE